jgi:hypothetical protein
MVDSNTSLNAIRLPTGGKVLCQFRSGRVVEIDASSVEILGQMSAGAGSGMSRTFGARSSGQASAICAGVASNLAASAASSGLARIWLPTPRGHPSGQKGTNAMFRSVHSMRTSRERRSARLRVHRGTQHTHGFVAMARRPEDSVAGELHRAVPGPAYPPGAKREGPSEVEI